MATYYVRPDGNNANTGTGPATNQAWATVAYALANAALPDATNTIYIAPGTYRGTVTMSITPSVSNTLVVSGDPTAAQFTGVTTGRIRVTNFLLDDALPTSASTVTIASKSYFTFQNIHFEGYATPSLAGMMALTDARNFTFSKCIFTMGNRGASTNSFAITSTTSTAINATIEKCIFNGGYTSIWVISTNTGTLYDFNLSVNNCNFVNQNGYGIVLAQGLSGSQTGVGNGAIVYNCIFNTANGVYINTTNTTNKSYFYNCNFIAGSGTGIIANASSVVEDYNRYSTAITLSGITGGTNSKVGVAGLDFGYSTLSGLYTIEFYAPYPAGVAQGTGTTSGAPATDIYGNTWSNTIPDLSAVTFKNPSIINQYLPTERNAATITIAPASTSQSIELYLGATGLTASTSGLSARYNRSRTASVAITLVARTIAQAWTSGGFAEVDATNMPGVYRLDIPDAAVAAGADDVTIVVRGASGTNGAVMTVKLSSGGLTAAQTAAAVWDEPYTSHTTASTFGARTLKTTVDNRPADVGTSFHIQSNVHAIVDSTAAASELSGALLHNGTDYISADLLTPVTAATSVHIGPYQLFADGLGADQPLDINVGTATSIDVQVTDANGTGIDITSATVTAKVYSSAGTLVATYSGTATYADNGRLTFGLTTTVTNTSGTYTVLVTRTTGATDTQIFGPLRLYVRPV